jgi:NADH:ubiquinone oxidoreductase subunit E
MAQTAQNDTKMKELDAFIDQLPTKKNALIQTLHRAQDIFGYLPQEVQTHVARKLELPSSRVYGVVTFYSFLKQEPTGRFPINVCMGTACFVRGSEAVLAEFQKELGIETGGITEDKLFSLESIRCVGACGLAPVVQVGGQVFGRVEPGSVKQIIDDFMAKGGLEDA